MTLKEAVRAVENYGGDRVHSVRDCGDEWAMNFESDVRREEEAAKLPFPESLFHSASCMSVIFANKTTGNLRWAWYISEDLDKIENGTPVPIPEDAHEPDLKIDEEVAAALAELEEALRQADKPK